MNDGSRHSLTATCLCAVHILAGMLFLLVLSATSVQAAPNIFDEDWTPPKHVEPPPISVPTPVPVVPPPSVGQPLPPTRPSVPQTAPVSPPVVAPSAPVVTRKPVPAKADQAKSRQLMREAFATELADRSVAGRRKLAANLIAEARKVPDNPSDQYVLLGGALDAGRECGGIAVCIEAADMMGRTFQVDALTVKGDALSRANLAVAESPTALNENLLTGLALVDQLLVTEDFATASHLCATMLSAAGNNASLRNALQQKARDVTAAKLLRDRVAQSVERLHASPGDPAANLAFGSYLCFSRADWQNGLPMLVRIQSQSQSCRSCRPRDADNTRGAGRCRRCLVGNRGEGAGGAIPGGDARPRRILVSTGAGERTNHGAGTNRDRKAAGVVAGRRRPHHGKGADRGSRRRKPCRLAPIASNGQCGARHRFKVRGDPRNPEGKKRGLLWLFQSRGDFADHDVHGDQKRRGLPGLHVAMGQRDGCCAVAAGTDVAARVGKAGLCEVTTAETTGKVPYSWIVFARQCSEGEKFAIRTEMQMPPLVIR